MKKLLPAALDVDGDGQLIFNGMFDQPAADLPGSRFVETIELQLLLFKQQAFQDPGHRFSFLNGWNSFQRNRLQIPARMAAAANRNQSQ